MIKSSKILNQIFRLFLLCSKRIDKKLSKNDGCNRNE